MTTKNDLAFPNIGAEWPNYPGLTKLEWYAGMALLVHVNTDNWATTESLAKTAFNIAEAMIAESEKRK